MKTILILITMLTAGYICAQNNLNIEQKSAAFSEALVHENYEDALSNVSDKISQLVTPAQLKEIWAQIQAQAGIYQNKAAINVQKENDIMVTYQPMTFKTTELDLKLAYNAAEQIDGILFLPHKVFELDLVSTDQIYEEEIAVKTSKEISLRGIITLPKTTTKVPAIILVHGSGPQDMDETVGPNKLFKDLAQELAKKGIAVIRYTKRTKEYGGTSKLDAINLTLYEETIEDAISAVTLAKKDKRIDKNNIFILGHSLGGMSAPRIALLSKATKGIIIMAGNARPLEVLIEEQYNHIFNEDSQITAEESKELALLEKQLTALEQLRKTGDTADDLPLGLPKAYWKYLIKYDQLEAAELLDKPMLILQGKRDYQVTMADFKLWKEVLGKKENVTYHAYEKLNHIMREGEGMSYASEYAIESPLPSYLIKDIHAWITAQNGQ